jgi:hypothetical protein
LVTPARRTETDAPGLAAARRRAVDVAAIAARTNAEGLRARSTGAHAKQ